MNDMLGELSETVEGSFLFADMVEIGLFNLGLGLDDTSWLNTSREVFKATLKMSPVAAIKSKSMAHQS